MAPDTTDGCIPSKMGAEEMEVVDIHNTVGADKNGTPVFVHFSAQDASI